MARLAVVDSTMHDARVLVERCRALGIEPVPVVHESGTEWRAESVGDLEVWSMDLGSDAFEERLLARLTQGGVAGAVTCSEFVMDAVHACTRRLADDRSDQRRVHSSRDKIDMYDALAAAGVAIPELLEVRTDHGVDHLGQLRWPVVVKPRDNAASKGVSVIERSEDLEPAVRHARRQSGPYGLGLSSDVLVQELVPGPEFSVESVVTQESIEHYGVVAKVTSRGSSRTELAHAFPAAVSPDRAKLLQETAAEVIRACGFSHTHVHTEMIWHRDRGPVVVEVAPRLPGGRITALLNLATQTSAHDRVVQLALGLPHDRLRPPSVHATVQHLTVDRPGIFRDVTPWPPRLSSVVEHGFSKPSGTEVRATRDNSARVAYAVFSGGQEQVAQDVERFRSGCRVVVDARKEAS